MSKHVYIVRDTSDFDWWDIRGVYETLADAKARGERLGGYDWEIVRCSVGQGLNGGSVVYKPKRPISSVATSYMSCATVGDFRPLASVGASSLGQQPSPSVKRWWGFKR